MDPLKQEGVLISVADGLVYKLTMSPVENPRILFDRLARTPVVDVPLSKSTAFILDSSDAQGISVMALDSLTLNADWFITNRSGNMVMTPILRPSGTNLSTGIISVEWTFEAGIRPVFMTVFNMEGSTTRGISGCFLFLVDVETGAFYAPPLPNVYENGALCTGVLSSVTGGIFDSVVDIFQQWSSNVWNLDLLYEWKKPLLDRVFRVDPTTMKPMPVEADQKNWFKSLPDAGYVPGANTETQEAVVNAVRRVVGIKAPVKK